MDNFWADLGVCVVKIKGFGWVAIKDMDEIMFLFCKKMTILSVISYWLMMRRCKGVFKRETWSVNWLL